MPTAVTAEGIAMAIAVVTTAVVTTAVATIDVYGAVPFGTIVGITAVTSGQS
jgi:hypothetical protein